MEWESYLDAEVIHKSLERMEITATVASWPRGIFYTVHHGRQVICTIGPFPTIAAAKQAAESRLANYR